MAGVPKNREAGFAGGSGASSYPGSFVSGNARRGRQGKGRVFGVPLEELVLNPERWGGGLTRVDDG